jgi:hypothetical protein
MGWIINNFWIKIIALILAVITWFYVHEEIVKDRQFDKQFYKPAQFIQQKESSQDKGLNIQNNIKTN